VFIKSSGLDRDVDLDKIIGDLYLFVELVTVVRVRGSAGKGLARKKHGHRGRNKDRENRENRGDDNSPSRSPVRSRSTKGKDGEKGDVEADHRDGADDEDDFSDNEQDRINEANGDSSHSHSSGIVPVVEMCSGWTLVPLGNNNQKRVQTHTVQMYGGTPFLPARVDKKKVVKRQGFFNKAKKLAGFGVKSMLTVSITAEPINSQVGREHAALAQDLPLNIALPRSTMWAVGLYRRLLRAVQQSTTQATDGRMLPQTGALKSVDPLFGLFPQILRDAAAKQAFMNLWASTCPNISNVTSATAEKALRESVMMVYRAMAQPAAKPAHHVAGKGETAEDVNRRYNIIFTSIENAYEQFDTSQTNEGFGTSLLSTGGLGDKIRRFREGTTLGDTLGSMALNNTMNINNTNNEANSSLANMTDATEFNTPFNPRELIWDDFQ
jgi:hypothetical protein